MVLVMQISNLSLALAGDIWHAIVTARVQL